jgi:hypothetical protein
MAKILIADDSESTVKELGAHDCQPKTIDPDQLCDMPSCLLSLFVTLPTP